MKLLALDIDKIITNSNQPRKYFDDEKMEELKISIKNNGLIQPIVVRKLDTGKYEIIAGERRYRACRDLGMKTVQVIKMDAGNSKSYEISVLENIQRENLNPIEEAESYIMLMEVYGYTQERLAEKLGKTRSSISNKTRILKLPETVKEMVKKNELSYGHARTLLSIQESEKIEDLAYKIIEKKYSVRETERIVKNYTKKVNKNFEKKEKNNENDVKLYKQDINQNYEEYDEKNNEKIFLENKLREFFETKVYIRGNIQKQGKIEIDFFDYEDLARIVGLMDIEFE
ncbi:ParB/RepB/Spo0J family partition protein [Leptotrichia sp. OH3620_COT-345]|uniref:ParB/RepB/Spo0J family partition protein n=1 Tax=Leptotrichia sp. OH3620_COT-345 TaxID=2491048 RepID=UPI000F646BA2|nr:ParB/RepB/Spo0J family partition protein [Leptotrichia sp. OH3620_COT-345]RRD40626.1 ParB/RepB/Spo0J family partition protein [Leptotrichia sp. OH3620_COT-345]